MNHATEPQVWVNGHLSAAHRASIPATDLGFRSGIGIFATLRCYAGRIPHLDAHLMRTVNGAAEVGIAVDTDQLAAAIKATVRANAEVHTTDDTVVRLTVSAGPLDPTSPFPGAATGNATVVVTTHDLVVDPAHAAGIEVCTVPLPRTLAHLKSISHLSAIVAQRHARALGAQDAILITDDGLVLEGAGGNVLAISGGRLHTPANDGRVLAGTTRAAILDLAKHLGLTVDEAPLPLATLLASDEVMLTSAVREVVAVVAVDGDPIGAGRPGPWTAALHRAYRNDVEQILAADLGPR